MRSLWDRHEAAATVAHYAERGIGGDVALRVYSSRLMGREPKLVQHGGGNTSVKSRASDLFGDTHDVIHVKGSGWDLETIEPEGLPALWLAPLRRLIELDRLADAEMVNVLRNELLLSSAPNPSVETLLHAFLPHKFVDHTHSSAVLAVVDQPNAVDICADVFGDRAPVVPYVMPGFELAKRAASVHARHPASEGLVLLKHGIFTYGEDARESYERMIDLVTLAERRIARATACVVPGIDLPKKVAGPSEIAPILRGAVTELLDSNEGLWRRQILAFRSSPTVLKYVNGQDAGRYSQIGVATPDHVIRTKGWPLLLPPPGADDLAAFAQSVRTAVATYADRYRAYFGRHNAVAREPKTQLDPMPRVLLVPGVGLFGVGKTVADACIAADLAETTIEVVLDANAVGMFEPISEAQMFEMEYWSLEQAKLAKASEADLTRQVVVVTGGGSGIGAATASAFATRGAAVAVLDVLEGAARSVASPLGGVGIRCDVTNVGDVRRAFDEVCRAFGGVDIAVSNAGAAWRGRIGEVDDASLRASFELNLFAHQTVARTAVDVFRKQGTGGVLLFNASKQAVNPGRDFGPYGLPKAATLFLSRQYAVDYGAEGIRSNAVNADRIRTGMLDDALIAERAEARGLSTAAYMRGDNLLQREVRAADVAEAFVALALARKTTGAVLTVDGGNIAAALR